MHFCQILTFSPAEFLVPLARHAEEVGFDAVAFSDHIVYPIGFETSYPYSADGMPAYSPTSPWMDPLVAIAACAAATERLRFFTNVYVLGYRHPIAVAKQVSSTSFLAGGRLAFGVGAGWLREEFEALDEPFERRGARMVEAIGVMRSLWSGEPVEHHGAFYDFSCVQMSPAPVDPIPVLFGGHTDLAVTRAARMGDGWLGLDYPVDELLAIVDRLHGLRREAGRSDEPFEIATGLRAKPEPEVCRELEGHGVTTLLTSAFGFGRSDPNDLDACRDAMTSYAERFIHPQRI
ncbi:MAG: TIGR03619 family F420-dependent LLM class oxidoreductase [Actinobacteria bacterium]|nr:TIGR03619 family F420-dependent LLM class oxidoreductase [Actinomycetota bacterium]